MSDQPNYENNPLYGVKLKDVLTELVDHYGWEILAAYLNINCFKKNPSIDSSLKFLRKTDWARDKVEGFYLYQFKSMPKADDEQYELPPRDRIIPDGIVPREPKELSLEDAERLRAKREAKGRSHRQATSSRPYGKTSKGTLKPSYAPRNSSSDKDNHAPANTKNQSVKDVPVSEDSPWANFFKK